MRKLVVSTVMLGLLSGPVFAQQSRPDDPMVIKETRVDTIYGATAIILTLAALYLARSVLTPVAFALFIIAHLVLVVIFPRTLVAMVAGTPAEPEESLR